MKNITKICIASICIIVFVATGCPQYIINSLDNNEKTIMLNGTHRGFFINSKHTSNKYNKTNSKYNHPRIIYIGEPASLDITD